MRPWIQALEEARPPTPQRILDAAEELFAQHGFDAVTTRDITSLAGVRLNLLSYHFGSKLKLFEAVIDRRLDRVIQRREEILATLRGSGQARSVRAILKAFIQPYHEMAATGDPGWLRYARLVSRTSQSERHYDVLDDYMRRTIDVFLAALREALPQAPEASLRSGFYYAVTLLMASSSGAVRIKELADNAQADAALGEGYTRLIVFAEAGLLAVASPDRPAAAQEPRT